MIDLNELMIRPCPPNVEPPNWWHPFQPRRCAIFMQLDGRRWWDTYRKDFFDSRERLVARRCTNCDADFAP